MHANREDEVPEWDAIEALWDEEDQRAAIRPELAASWSKLKMALKEFAYETGVALSRASVQQRRGAFERALCLSAARLFDRAFLRLA